MEDWLSGQEGEEGEETVLKKKKKKVTANFMEDWLSDQERDEDDFGNQASTDDEVVVRELEENFKKAATLLEQGKEKGWMSRMSREEVKKAILVVLKTHRYFSLNYQVDMLKMVGESVHLIPEEVLHETLVQTGGLLPEIASTLMSSLDNRKAKSSLLHLLEGVVRHSNSILEYVTPTDKMMQDMYNAVHYLYSRVEEINLEEIDLDEGWADRYGELKSDMQVYVQWTDLQWERQGEVAPPMRGKGKQGDGAEEQGDGAEEQGDGAEEQGDGAAEQGDSASELGDGATEQAQQLTEVRFVNQVKSSMKG